MRQSLLVLLSRSVDYAGMFPPAALSFGQAVDRYLAALAGSERFLLARFVCPAGSLGGVEALRPSPGAPPTVVAVLGPTGDRLEELRERTLQVGQAMQPWLGGGALAIDQYEVALPRSVVEGGADAVAEAARAVSESLQTPRRLLVALEVPLAGSPPALVGQAVEGIAKANQQSPITPVCLKLRCGGNTAAAVPSPAELAHALIAARDNGVLVKATQGLHHAFRHWDAQLGTAATHLAGTLSLRQTAALMSRLDYYIGVDTGPTHIMGALGRPMMSFYHPSSPAHLLQPLQHPALAAVDHPLAGQVGPEAPMAGLTVDSVWTKLEPALAGLRAR